ncbi:hypothetical protein J6590_050667 [Homalodisca vitripennis]|nr:hypothetical protein J6590_050667 [Homalodisca vitripennis]
MCVVHTTEQERSWRRQAGEVRNVSLTDKESRARDNTSCSYRLILFVNCGRELAEYRFTCRWDSLKGEALRLSLTVLFGALFEVYRVAVHLQSVCLCVVLIDSSNIDRTGKPSSDVFHTTAGKPQRVTTNLVFGPTPAREPGPRYVDPVQTRSAAAADLSEPRILRHNFQHAPASSPASADRGGRGKSSPRLVAR